MNYFSIHFNISCGHLRWLFQKRSLKKNSWPHKLPAREKQEYGLARVIFFQRDLLADTLIKKSHVLCCPIMGSNVFRFRILYLFSFLFTKALKSLFCKRTLKFWKIIRYIEGVFITLKYIQLQKKIDLHCAGVSHRQETKINCSFHHWDILLKFSCEMYICICSLKFEHAGLSFWPYFSSLFSQDHQGCVGTSHLDFFFFFERWLTEVLTKPIRTLPCEIRIM